MKIYRYEHKDTGVGPYNHVNVAASSSDEIWELAEDLKDGHHNRSGLRTLLGKAGYSGTENWLSACRSREELRRWFWGFNKRIQALGYRVIEYTVLEPRHVLDADGQVVVHKEAIKVA